MPRPIRVLLVDDHATVLWGLQKLVEARSPAMEVAGTATSVTEALAKAESLRPDVILLDLYLGNESSVSCVPELKVRSGGQIVVLTGVGDRVQQDLAVLGGARGMVRKEEAAERILQAIDKVVEGQFWLDREATTRVFEAFMQRDAWKARFEQSMDRLTSKEKQVVQALIEDATATNKELAKKLCLSEHTLRHHLTSIYQKLGVNNRFAVYLYVTGEGQQEAGANRPAASPHSPRA